MQRSDSSSPCCAVRCLAERLRRTADRIDPARVSRSFRRLGRNTSAPDLANPCPLLQRDQNPLVAGQRCAGLSSHSTYWNHQLTRDPWQTASLLLLPDFRFSAHTGGDRRARDQDRRAPARAALTSQRRYIGRSSRTIGCHRSSDRRPLTCRLREGNRLTHQPHYD